MPSRSLDAWLALLETRHPQAIELGLERIRRVQAAMALPRPAPCVITVGGTNGKGSTVACLDALLRAGGQRCGTYTSPHLVHFRERVRIAGEPVSDAVWCEAFTRVEAALDGVSLTYFEFTTLAALDILARAGLDAVVLEVGLGGRLDAVNAVDADIAVVTRIALDHQDWLGDSLAAIAQEKAGIFRAGCPVVCGQADPPAELPQAAAAIGAPWLCRDRDFAWQASPAGLWCWQGRGVAGPVTLDGLPPVRIPQDSAATALQVLACLGRLPAAGTVRTVLAELTVAGRFQHAAIDGTTLILDVAHNPDASRWLARQLADEPCQGRTLAVFAALADKDIDGIVAPMAAVLDAWFLADLPGVGRAAPASQLADAVQRTGSRMISVSRNPRQALARARSLVGPADRIVVFGSFYTVGTVLALLER